MEQSSIYKRRESWS